MPELLIAVGIVAALVLAAIGGHFLHGPILLGIGAATSAAGLTIGVIVGVRYHLALYRALGPMGILGSGWWWRPTSYHARLPSANRRTVMPWFHAGVISMAVALAGCALMLAGILRF
ncbi:MAG: hypothetical protein HY695_19950 [Deltaproteobacteria bacterium]|nr:hypothetical protein [Deltaproteobacteria bacterium]